MLKLATRSRKTALALGSLHGDSAASKQRDAKWK
jgi:hypothetical protein